MTTARLIIAALLPFFMSLQTSPNRKPAAVKISPPPTFSTIDARLLGENLFGVYLFDKKNVGTTKEVTERGRSGDRDVYVFHDTQQVDMPGSNSVSSYFSTADAESFSLQKLEYESVKTGPDKQETEKRADCEALRLGVVRCDFGGTETATETVTFDNGGLPIYYDGAVDRFERIIDWRPDMRIGAAFLDIDQKKLKHYIITAGRLSGAATGTLDNGSFDIHHHISDDNIDITVTLKSGEVSRVFWADGDIELTGYPAADEKSARAERVKFAADVPPSERTPTQVFILLLTAMVMGNKDAVIQSFDMKRLYEEFKKTSTEQPLPPYTDWEKLFTDMIVAAPQGAALAPRGEDPAEMAVFLEAMDKKLFVEKIDGDEAAVTFKSMGNSKAIIIRLHRAPDGWKIYWIDGLGDAFPGGGK